MIGTDEALLAARIEKALGAWTGPVDVSPGLVRHLAKELVDEGRPGEESAAVKPRRQIGGNLTPPCNHRDEFIGTVEAGDHRNPPHASVSTCGPCANRSAGYVEAMTGERAKPLLTFEEVRNRARAAQGRSKEEGE